MNRFVRELRRREVFRAAGLYVGVIWILIEAASVLLPTFDAPDWVMRVIVAILGFLVMLVLAWIYNLTGPNNNGAQKGRHYLFGSGGVLCTLARSPQPFAILDVPLIAA